MSSLKEKLIKNSTIKETAVLTESKVFDGEELVPLDVPAMNIAFSGSLDGGLCAGLTQFAGPSKHFKTLFSFVCARAYLNKYPDAIMLFYDSEFGSPKSYFKALGIDTDRVIHSPILDIEKLKHDLTSQLDNIEKKDKVIIVIDSIGNLASKKEAEDALEGKSVADMSRAKQLKSLFRIVTPHLTLKQIPMIVINHTYKTMELYAKDVVGGGCLLAGTKLVMFDGSLKEIQDIKQGELVKTLNGAKPVTATWNPETLVEGTPECFEFEFEDGYKVTCSSNHPFLTTEGWIKACELTEQHEIVKI